MVSLINTGIKLRISRGHLASVFSLASTRQIVHYQPCKSGCRFFSVSRNIQGLVTKEHSNTKPIITWRIFLMFGVVCGSVVLVMLYMQKKRDKQMETLQKEAIGKVKIGGEWEMMNTEGRLEGSLDLRGKWVLMYFGFTNCPDICPEEIEKMVRVVDILEKDKELIPIVPVFISMDPGRDTKERVKKYCEEFSPKIRGYTGTKEQVEKMSKTFRVYYSQGPKTYKDDYIVDHTVIMYLIGPEGEFIDYFGQIRTAKEIADIIRIKYNAKKIKQRKFDKLLNFLSSKAEST